ncbi:nonstructural protein [Microvirus mar21]|uniref:Nonstructural protein n=1 Tax=Microvirus mar21 TaxID=2851154 RepID=A0A8F5MKJ0_9VIRU|nr:nonstructural protein [Microvirus mar21]
MIYNVYAIDDLKTTYLSPALAPSHAAAIRDFKLAYAQPGTPLHECPEDFRLVLLGTYDNSNGKLSACELEVIFDGKNLNAGEDAR